MARLTKQAALRLNRAKKRLNINGFDELNVLKVLDVLFETLDDDNRKAFMWVFCERFAEVAEQQGFKIKKGKEDTIYEMAEMFLILGDKQVSIQKMAEKYIKQLLDTPNENTNYAYSTESIRKRDRAKEAVQSAPTRTQKQILLDKSVRMFEQMTAWYVDFVSQGAELQAFEATGVKKVVRHEMDDDKVCAVCRKADGEIYEISKIPPLPHLRCRRYFTPYKGK